MSTSILHMADFPGGLHLDYRKDLVGTQPIATAPIPPQLVIPLAQHIGAPADAIVQIGDHVKRGQCIGRAHGYVSLSVHASSSGTVTAIEDRPVAHPSGVPARCVVIDTDGADTVAAPDWTPPTDYHQCDASALRDIARAAGIAGLGGAAFPTSVKLNPGRPVDALIINGAECEPYIACDQALMVEDADGIVAGIQIMLHALHAPECLIGIEDNKPEAIRALTAAAAADARIRVVTVPTRYPQGGEKQLIQTLTGREVPSQGLPLDIGIVCQNPGTVRAVYRAVVHGEALTDRVVSLTGTAMAQPRNVRARIGTPLGWLAAQYGGYVGTPGRLLMGGPMMGVHLPDDNVPLVKGTNCLLAMAPEDVAPPEPAMACIRCGACAEACPAKLLPQQLYWHARAREFDKTQAYNLFDCIECGCCAAVCPSHIPLVQYYRFAKGEIWAEERERIASDAARVRFEAREQRLQREAEEKAAARAARKQRSKGTEKEDPPARDQKKPHSGGTSDAVAADTANVDDPVARAKAAARARRAEGAAAAATSQPADTTTASPGSPAASDDPVARARAAARARKQAATSPDNPPVDNGESGEASGGETDPIARAKAAARARKKQAGDSQDMTAADDPVARAKAAREAAGASADAENDS